MHRSSETVAAIATALAKAQVELTNPEKTAIGLISHISQGVGERTFRYAPLSSGLELVRKSLGGHQIAVLQTTEIDRPSGTVNLTTVLMHSSGEWISSNWPVCQLSEATMPRRMGAALTYARRYSLFAIVGIAGEDEADLDTTQDTPAKSADLKPGQPASLRLPARQVLQSDPASPNLTIEQSAALRENLLDQIRNWQSIDLLHDKTIELLRAKNSLLKADAKIIESEFEAKLTALQQPAGIDLESSDIPLTRDHTDDGATPRRRRRNQPAPVKLLNQDQEKPIAPVSDPSEQSAIKRRLSAIDKSLLALGEPRRHRDKAHLRFVAMQPCLICERTPSDPHHLRFAQPRAMGRKASDEFVVPLCRTHHRLNHQNGNELTWWQDKSANPLEVARQLWNASRGIAGGG